MDFETDISDQPRTGFDRLLAVLDGDRDEAGLKFEALRRRLVRFFDWRGAFAPDECADATLDRLAAKLDAGVAVASINAYTFAIARLVLLEQSRRPDQRAVSLADAPDEALAAPLPAPTTWSDCLDRSLDTLTDDERRLILRYYAHTKRDKIDDRAALAAELGITVSALRNRAQRLRDRLERRVADCVQTHGTT